MRKHIKSFFGRARRDLDANGAHENILKNEYLLDTTLSIYNEMALGNDVSGEDILEIGSAGGVAKIFSSNIITSDIREFHSLDLVLDAKKLPFESASLDQIWAKDTIHHLDNPELFFEEAFRTLRPGGRLAFCEPYWSPFAKFVFRYLHPEEYSKKSALKKMFHPGGNQALFYALFTNRKFFNNSKLKEFNLIKFKPINGLAFAISGGATFSTNFNSSLLMKISRLELSSKKWLRIFGLNVIVVFEKPI
jgi:SAM-dependent methyltransferase